MANVVREAAMKSNLRTTLERHTSSTIVHRNRVKKPYQSPMKRVVRMTRTHHEQMSSISYFNSSSRNDSFLPTVIEEDDNSSSSYSNNGTAEVYSFQLLRSVSRSTKSLLSDLSTLVQSSEDYAEPNESIPSANADQSLIGGLCIDDDID
jgi:hypothetical protein